MPFHGILTRQLIADAADVASLISLALTGLVYLKLRKMQADVLFKARMPELIRRLEKRGREISQWLGEDPPEDPRAIQILLRKYAADLRGVRTVSPKRRRQIDQILVFIADLPDDAQLIYHVIHGTYVEMMGLTQELKDEMKERDWRLPDGT